MVSDTLKQKVAFVDPCFHNETKSADFFRELLSEEFEVINIYEKSWKETTPETVEEINKANPHAVIFHQVLPTTQTMELINCKNITFSPMIDNEFFVMRNRDWTTYSSLRPKIICFSKAMNQIFEHIGARMLQVQYFPLPVDKYVQRSSKPTIFFWQRHEYLNWNNVKAWIGEQEIEKVILKNHPDPFHKFIKPSEEDIKKYNITIIDGWLPKEEYLTILDKSNIFIAPRMLEGIGLAYLEAMSHGCCVIAWDAPTSNEYIQNGITGILCDPSNLSQIDLTNANEYGKNAQEYMIEGHLKWIKDKKRINEFIKSN